MAYWYQIKMKIRLIMVNTSLYFIFRNTLINFMVTLSLRFKLKWAIHSSTSFTWIWEFSFAGFSRLAIYKLIIVVTLILKIFLTKIITESLGEIIPKLLRLSKYFSCSVILFPTCGTIFNIPQGIYIVIDNIDPFMFI